MPLQEQMPGTVRSRKADWVRGRGPGSMHGELKRGNTLRKNSRMKKCGMEQRKHCRMQSIGRQSERCAKWILHGIGGMHHESS